LGGGSVKKLGHATGGLARGDGPPQGGADGVRVFGAGGENGAMVRNAPLNRSQLKNKPLKNGFALWNLRPTCSKGKKNSGGSK